MAGEEGNAVPLERALEANHPMATPHRMPAGHVRAMRQRDASCPHPTPRGAAHSSRERAQKIACDLLNGLVSRTIRGQGC